MDTKYKIVKVYKNDGFYDDEDVIGKIGKFQNDGAHAPRGYVGGTFYPDGEPESEYYIFYGVKLEEVKE
jgi:hypothetical protein